ncbi:hypothetical protein ACR2V4_27230, partial [Klebsiella pneumoniae]
MKKIRKEEEEPSGVINFSLTRSLSLSFSLMAKPQDTQPFLHNISPIKDHERAGSHTDPEDDYLQPSGCACFRLFSLGTGEGEQKETSWIKNKLQKAKEVSEVMAGPKWKNFLRRIGKWFHRKKKS